MNQLRSVSIVHQCNLDVSITVNTVVDISVHTVLINADRLQKMSITKCSSFDRIYFDINYPL